MPLLVKALQFLQTHADLIRVFLGSTGLLYFTLAVGRWVNGVLRKYVSRRTLRGRLNSGSYSKQEIDRSTSCYIVPDCQNIDPSGAEDWRLRYPLRQNAFITLDEILGPDNYQKYSLILADSGMGKTSLVLNYAARHWKSKSRNKAYHLAVIPLGQADAENQISRIERKSDTVLFLDALDEDTKAIEDHRKRVSRLLDLSKEFRHVLITCRTQFFPRDEEIPAETGVLRLGPTAAGHAREYLFHKLYLSPFSDKQVAAFIRKRFPFVRYKERRQARVIIGRIKDLSARPMILAHIPDLLDSDSEFTYSFEIYEEIVTAWLTRERPLVADTEGLRRLCEVLAVEILAGRREKGSEKIASKDLDRALIEFEETQGGLGPDLVKRSLERWQVQGRSLLNRDATGNWKFAHRSLLEHMATKHLVKTGLTLEPELWTDQMKVFCWERLRVIRDKGLPFPLNAGNIPFGDVQLPPFALVRLRPQPTKFDSIQEAELQCRKVVPMREARVGWPKAFQIFGPFWRKMGGDTEDLDVRSAEDYMEQYERMYGQPAPLIPHRKPHDAPEESIVISAIGLHDYVTDLDWTIVEEIYHPQHDLALGDPRSRLPTLEEALSLVHVLRSQNEILVSFLRETKDLRILTSDRSSDLRSNECICVHILTEAEGDFVVTAGAVSEGPRVIINKDVDFTLDMMRQTEHVKQLLALQKLIDSRRGVHGA